MDILKETNVLPRFLQKLKDIIKKCSLQNINFSKQIQKVAMGLAVITIVFGGLIGTLFTLYLYFFTRYWSLVLTYLFWCYIIDFNTCEQGGRRNKWVQGWAWWKILRDYFPLYFEKLDSAEFDPKRNYLFCSFPHGILPFGAFSAFATTSGGFQKLFPEHTANLLTIAPNFHFPISRELFYALGACSSSAKSLDWILKPSNKGKIAVLTVGGAEEAFYSRPGQYKILLKKRKGFIKMALKHGCPLVPVFSFGVTDIYNQVDNPKGSVLRYIQDWFKYYTGVAPTLANGCGLLQDSFGIIPFALPIYTIVGNPIEVNKNEKPTQEEIDSLHETFLRELKTLFDEQKCKYLENSKTIELIIE